MVSLNLDTIRYSQMSKKDRARRICAVKVNDWLTTLDENDYWKSKK